MFYKKVTMKTLSCLFKSTLYLKTVKLEYITAKQISHNNYKIKLMLQKHSVTFKSQRDNTKVTCFPCLSLILKMHVISRSIYKGITW